MKTLPGRREAATAIAIEIVVNVALPYAIYAALQPKAGDLLALLASSAPPIVWSVAELVRKRRVDAISLIVLAGIVLGLLAFVGGGSVKLLQLRENLVTGLVGLVFIGSALIRRPVALELARAGLARRSSAATAEREPVRDDARFRRTTTVMTLVWGFSMLALTALACALVFMLPIGTYLIVGPVASYMGFAAVGIWTIWYARRSRPRQPENGRELGKRGA